MSTAKARASAEVRSLLLDLLVRLGGLEKAYLKVVFQLEEFVWFCMDNLNRMCCDEALLEVLRYSSDHWSSRTRIRFLKSTMPTLELVA